MVHFEDCLSDIFCNLTSSWRSRENVGCKIAITAYLKGQFKTFLKELRLSSCFNIVDIKHTFNYFVVFKLLKFEMLIL